MTRVVTHPPRRTATVGLVLVLVAALVALPTTGATAQTAPDFPHVTVTYTDPGTGATATAWVQQDVDTDPGATVRIVGEGWTNGAGSGGSTIALKLDYRTLDGTPGQYTRSGSGIIEHPSASGDDTIWVLLAPGTSAHPNVYPVASGGSFDVTFDAPSGLEAGQYLSVLFQSGRFQTGDVQRTVTSEALIVGGTPYEGGDEEEQATCVPTSATATVEIVDPDVELGGQLHVRGAGWCHPDEERGGSVVAIKIDEGAYSHPAANAVHPNRTIWAIVEADEEDGTFDTRIVLPDGTAATSEPAFPEGAHTLRLLTGSLKPGDTPRTVRSEEFVVGEYRPVGTPPPVEATEDLTDATRGGVSVARSGDRLLVTVPGASAGDWIFLTAYAPDGSPRYPWGATWFRADAAGRVSAPLAGITVPEAGSKLAVQSGDQGRFGDLLGWSELPVEGGQPGSGVSCPATTRTFPDVPSDSVHRDAVGCLAELGVVLGRADGSFDPSGSVTRAQAASMLARLLDAWDVDLPRGSGFADVDPAGPHGGAIASLAALEIIEGKGGGRFDPSGTLTRAQTASVLARAAEVMTGRPLPAGRDAFSDDDGSVHEAAIDAAASAGLVEGKGGRRFAPQDDVRRDQLASILARAIDRLG